MAGFGSMKFELTPLDRALLEELGNAMQNLAGELREYNQQHKTRTVVVNNSCTTCPEGKCQK